MANAIDLVVAQQAMDQLASLIAKLNEVDAKMLAISKNAISLGGQIGGINTPSGGATNGANNASVNASIATQSDLNKKLAASIQLLQAKYTELTRARGNGQKTLLEEQAAVREQLRLATLEAKAVNDSYNAYQKKDAEYKKAVLAAKELGAVHGSTSAVFLKEAAAVNKLADELKAIDAKLGNHTRSVGNYASGWNGLSNSVNQLTREAPAFANSMQTGFMAISNNIPILVDELNNLKKANADVAASGGKTQTVMSALTGAIFSWQTLLSIGVTLLTVYGAKIIDWAQGLGDAKQAMDELILSQKKHNKAMTTSDEAIDHQIYMLKEKAKQAKKTDDEINALDELGARKKLSERQKTKDELTETYNLVKIARQINAKEELDSGRNGLLRAAADRKRHQYMTKEEIREEKRVRDEAKQIDLLRIGATEKERRKILALSGDEAFKLLESQLQASESEVQKSGMALSEIVASNKSKELDIKKDGNKKEEDLGKYSAELRRKELELELANIDTKLNNEELYYISRLDALEKDFLKRIEIAQVDYDEELRLAKGNQNKQKTALINFQLEKIKLLEAYNAKKKALTVKDTDEETLKSLDEAQKGIDKAKEIRDRINANAAVAGFQLIEKGIDDQIKKDDELKQKKLDNFNEIANASKKFGDIMAEFSDRNFKNEYARLEAQKDIALKFAGDSSSAKQKISEDYEKKQKEIANRENKAKQKQAIFNIAIDTAQAIMGLWVKPGFPAAIPMAVAVGALGALQIGMVASQKIPQYFDGGVHDGGLAMINDGGGSNYVETVVTPDGKVSQYSGRDVVTNLPKGTEIFTPEQWQEKELHNMLQSRGISMNVSKQNGGMTAQEMDMVLAKHFKKIQTTTMNIDKNGFSMFTESNGNKTIRNANRVSGTGFKI